MQACLAGLLRLCRREPWQGSITPATKIPVQSVVPARIVCDVRCSTGCSTGGNRGRIEDGCKGTRRFGLHTREDVLICRHREGRGGVAEPFTYDLDWDAGLQQKRGMRVAEVVVMPTSA